MKELLNLEGYGLSLVLHEDNTYEVIDCRDFCSITYPYDNRAEAVSHIATDILNPKRIYDPESVPDDLRCAYGAIDQHPFSIRIPTHTFLFYVLDDIAATNELAYRIECGQVIPL